MTLIAQAQDSLSLEIIVFDKSEALNQRYLEKEITYQKRFKTAPQIQKELAKVILQLQKTGYLAASIDSVAQRKTSYTAYLYAGVIYEWAKLANGNVEPAFLAQIGFRERLYSNKPFDYQQVVHLQERLLTYAENNGYPFASVWLGDIQIKNGGISAKLYLTKNQLIRIEAIKLVESNVNISTAYLENYLDIKKGDLYNESKIKNIRKRLSELQFLSEKQGTKVIFEGKKATINLILEERKASRFDFLVGFLPRNEETGGLTLTGNVQLYFQNLLGRGELINAHWQQLRPSSPQLDMHFLYAYLFDLPFGIDFNFHLYRRDSSYLDLNYDIGVQYLFEGGNYLKAFFENKSTRLLTVNENTIIQSRQLPRNLDIINTIFGLEYALQRLDYRYNPRKGYDLKFKGGAGIKRIPKNNLILELSDTSIPDFEFATLYDSLNLRSYQFRLAGTAAYYFPIGSRGTLKTGIQAGTIFAQDSIYRNELYRIGGNRLLRGFDEESIFASLYAVGTLEARLLTGQNAYLFAFLDYGFVRDFSVGSNRLEDTPLGVGIGITLGVGSGTLVFSVAMGQQNNNSIDFQAAKIHVGYVSFF